MKKQLFLSILISIVLIDVSGAGGSRVAAASTPSTSCASLSSRLSDDKNSQVFSAIATPASNETIEGFTFNFGDSESYSFTFNDEAPNRTTATVSHTYQREGTFKAVASVQVMAGGHQSSVTSQACTTQVVIGGQPSDGAGSLVNTGPGNALFIVLVCLVAGIFHWIARRTLYLKYLR